METATAPTPIQSAQLASPAPIQPQVSPPVPTVDLKAPLKIETAKEEISQVDYGQKLFLFGVMFCVVIAISVIVLTYFWTQNTNQPQQVATVEASQ